MRIIITIPDNLFRRDIENKFKDFFERVIVDIAGSLNNENTGLCGLYELETATFLKKAFAHGLYDEEE